MRQLAYMQKSKTAFLIKTFVMRRLVRPGEDETYMRQNGGVPASDHMNVLELTRTQMQSTYLRVRMFARKNLDEWLNPSSGLSEDEAQRQADIDDLVEEGSEAMRKCTLAIDQDPIRSTIALRVMHHFFEGEIKFPWWGAVIVHEYDFFKNYEKLVHSLNPLIVISLGQYAVIDKPRLVAFGDESGKGRRSGDEEKLDHIRIFGSAEEAILMWMELMRRKRRHPLNKLIYFQTHNHGTFDLTIINDIYTTDL